MAIMIPRPETAPVSLALYLLSDIPFAMLLPVDLLTQAYRPGIYPDAPHEKIEAAFQNAGKITILTAQMTWVVSNFPSFAPIETFSNDLQTTVNLPGADDGFQDPVPQTVENWILAQMDDPTFPIDVAAADHAATRGGLHIIAPPDAPARIHVPQSTREPLVRAVHRRMFHLGSAKIAAAISRTFFWKSLKADTRKILSDCPECELEKARQKSAHGLFSARPHDAPRARYAMDFQGMGTAVTGETQALGIIDTTARYAIVIPLADREATTFIQPFLDNLVFVHGPPDILHSDAAQEFLSEAMQLLANATDTHTTTTLGHNAKANGTMEISGDTGIEP